MPEYQATIYIIKIGDTLAMRSRQTIQLLHPLCSLMTFSVPYINPQHPRRENSVFSKLEKLIFVWLITLVLTFTMDALPWGCFAKPSR